VPLVFPLFLAYRFLAMAAAIFLLLAAVVRALPAPKRADRMHIWAIFAFSGENRRLAASLVGKVSRGKSPKSKSYSDVNP
jgi:hypothetical protein